jgi:hypothetical protein
VNVALRRLQRGFEALQDFKFYFDNPAGDVQPLKALAQLHEKPALGMRKGLVCQPLEEH